MPHRPTPKKVLTHAREMRQRDTSAEKRAWICLRDRRTFGLKFRRQVPIDRYIVDFYCHELQLIIEIDGGVHAERRSVESDKIREARLKALGFSILHFPNDVILNDPEVLSEATRGVLWERGIKIQD